MGKITTDKIDLSAEPNPPSGQFTVAFDLDNVLKQIDSSGNITPIGGIINIQGGTNIQTGGTITSPIISTTNDVIFNSVSATTFYSGSTDLSLLLGGGGGSELKTFLVPLDYTMFTGFDANPLNQGTGYADGVYTGVTCTTLTGAGTGAIAIVKIVAGSVDFFTFTSYGNNYLQGDTVTPNLPNGVGTDAVIEINRNAQYLNVGRLPSGYRYFGFIIINNTKWNDGTVANQGGQLFIFDTVARETAIGATAAIDIPFLSNYDGDSLSTASNVQQKDGSTSLGFPIQGYCFLDGDGLQGITVLVQMDVPLNTLENGDSSLYIIATKIPTNPDGLLPVAP